MELNKSKTSLIEVGGEGHKFDRREKETAREEVRERCTHLGV